ncbi:MAG: hypothetical protein ACN4GZ_08665 [Acidimicrobiales bacterium]
MRSGNLIGGAMLTAGVLSLAVLVVPSSPALVADVRLDDHETSWPDHREVQDDAVDALSPLLVPLDAEATARQDRSTVEVVGSDPTSRDFIDAAIAEVIDADRQSRRNDENAAAVRDQFETAEALALEAEQSEADLQLISARVSEVNELRSELADHQIGARSARSRFVALGSAAPPENPRSPAQWIATAGILAAGAAVLARERFAP